MSSAIHNPPVGSRPIERWVQTNDQVRGIFSRDTRRAFHAIRRHRGAVERTRQWTTSRRIRRDSGATRPWCVRDSVASPPCLPSARSPTDFRARERRGDRFSARRLIRSKSYAFSDIPPRSLSSRNDVLTRGRRIIPRVSHYSRGARDRASRVHCECVDEHRGMAVTGPIEREMTAAHTHDGECRITLKLFYHAIQISPQFPKISPSPRCE